MSQKILIIHGYSDGSTSFTALRDYLRQQGGYAREAIYFLQYSSMDDEATFRDFADKLDTDYGQLFGNERIDVIVHSTGALVVRAWLALHRRRALARGEKAPCPVRRLVMFAPANFGSDLATLGQSFLGKLRCTFFNRHSHRGKDFLESGKVVLQGLEPASPFQWELSAMDLHSEISYFNAHLPEADRCYPFVLAAGESYSGLQARLIKKRKKPGTDGTVRICGTSLNTRKCTISFRRRGTRLSWHTEHKYPLIPFAVFPGLNHGSIVNPRQKPFRATAGPGPLALKALQVETDQQYRGLALKCHALTEKNFRTQRRRLGAPYQQFFFRVRDDVDLPVPDYYLDFYVVDARNKAHRKLTERFDRDFEATFYRHSADPTCRVMLLNCTKLKQFVRDLQSARAKLVFDITAKSPLPDVSFQPGRYTVFDGTRQKQKDDEYSFLYPNTTTLVDVVLNREQTDKLAHLLDQNLKRVP